MPKVLVLKVRGRHVERDNFWHFLAKFWPEKITSRDGCFLPTNASSISTPSGKVFEEFLKAFRKGFEGSFG